mgnify:CR=1 FL=1
MITQGTILRAKKSMSGVEVGDEFVVGHIDSNGIITACGNKGYGVMLPDEVGKLFEVVDHKPKPKPWTAWTWEHDEFSDYCWKTNGKVVKVRLWNGVSGKASCCPDDEFDVHLGIDIAKRRAAWKFYQNVAQQFVDRHGPSAFVFGNP